MGPENKRLCVVCIDNNRHSRSRAVILKSINDIDYFDEIRLLKLDIPGVRHATDPKPSVVFASAAPANKEEEKTYANFLHKVRKQFEVSRHNGLLVAHCPQDQDIPKLLESVDAVIVDTAATENLGFYLLAIINHEVISDHRVIRPAK